MAAKTATASRNGSPRVVDVDAARAARLEKLGPPPLVHVGGRDFELPAELPSDAVYAFGEVQAGNFAVLDRAFRTLFGDNAEAILALCPSWPDQEYLFQGVIEAYGFALPES